MMEMSKLNENHKLLADMNGNWNYTIKIWMNPDPKRQTARIQRHRYPQEHHGRPLRGDGCDRQNADAGSKTAK